MGYRITVIFALVSLAAACHLAQHPPQKAIAHWASHQANFHFRQTNSYPGRSVAEPSHTQRDRADFERQYSSNLPLPGPLSSTPPGPVPAVLQLPARCRRMGNLTMYYDPGERQVDRLAELLQEAERTVLVRAVPARPVYQVVIFSDRRRYAAVCKSMDPANARAPGSAAGAAGNTLFICRLRDLHPSRLPRLARHEYAHMVINAAAGGRPLPRWLAEGIACWATGYAGPAERQIPDEFLSFPQMEQAFLGADRRWVNTAYAQAFHLVALMVELRGEQALGRLLAGLAMGLPLEEAMAKHVGIGAQALWETWRQRASREKEGPGGGGIQPQ